MKNSTSLIKGLSVAAIIFLAFNIILGNSSDLDIQMNYILLISYILILGIIIIRPELLKPMIVLMVIAMISDSVFLGGGRFEISVNFLHPLVFLIAAYLTVNSRNLGTIFGAVALGLYGFAFLMVIVYDYRLLQFTIGPALFYLSTFLFIMNVEKNHQVYTTPEQTNTFQSNEF